MSATMRDVARVAGVSLKTVSNVVNDYPYVRPETRRRVTDAIAALRYEVNVSARNLSSGRTGMVALAIPEVDQPYYARLADAAMSAAAERGLTVLVETTGGLRERELAALSTTRRQITDGLVIDPVSLGPQDLCEDEDRFPLVVLGEGGLGAGVEHVAVDAAAAVRAATDHLLALGRRRIALVGAPGAEDAGAVSPWVHGYEAALAGVGLDVDPVLIRRGAGWRREHGAAAVAALLDSGHDIDAVLCLDDALALGAMRELHVRGHRIPQDVAVMGFDDTDAGRYAIPSLSTLTPGPRAVGRLAIERLCAQLGRPRGRQGATVSPIDVTVEARESTVGAFSDA